MGRYRLVTTTATTTPLAAVVCPSCKGDGTDIRGLICRECRGYGQNTVYPIVPVDDPSDIKALRIKVATALNRDRDPTRCRLNSKSIPIDARTLAQVESGEWCHANRDGECYDREICPQLRDGEPAKTHRWCPLSVNDPDIV